jgi:hypothetical protein
MPCKVASKSEEVVICEQFDNLYAEDGIASLEELKAINASIPEDPIEEQVTDFERDNCVDGVMVPQ